MAYFETLEERKGLQRRVEALEKHADGWAWEKAEGADLQDRVDSLERWQNRMGPHEGRILDLENQLKEWDEESNHRLKVHNARIAGIECSLHGGEVTKDNIRIWYHAIILVFIFKALNLGNLNF